jgi:membrane protease YdiL (CAAX protease family)
MIACWGTCLIGSANGITLADHFVLYIPYLLGGFSPTIASLIVTKKQKSFREWLADIFDFKQSLFSYIAVMVFSVLFILPQCLISGYKIGAPLYAIVFMIPMMLLGGGLEEAGWRYILQPMLEKKYHFMIATLLTGIIWWVWHLPLFFIQGVSQYGQNFFAFGINVLGLSFALASIRKTSQSVWLCVLFHCIVNSLSGIYIVNNNIWGNVVSAVVLMVASFIFITMNDKKKIRK